jgi:hypothetical protein
MPSDELWGESMEASRVQERRFQIGVGRVLGKKIGPSWQPRPRRGDHPPQVEGGVCSDGNSSWGCGLGAWAANEMYKKNAAMTAITNTNTVWDVFFTGMYMILGGAVHSVNHAVVRGSMLIPV